MLGAFLTPALRDWILSGAGSRIIYRNHWLVRKSAVAAFSQGFFQFTFTNGHEVGVSFIYEVKRRSRAYQKV